MDTPDLVLRGGRVIDPANGIDGPMDVSIRAGRIDRIAPSIEPGLAAQAMDVSGLVVTPGILDIHTHVYPFRVSEKSYVGCVDADAHLFASGVTTTVDAGTSGWEHFLDFKSAAERAKVRVLAFLNIARSGMVDAQSEQREADMDPRIAAAFAQAFPEFVVGIKSAHYWTRDPWDALHRPWTSVERAVEAAELCGRPVMVDFWPRPPERPYPDLILKKLRPGDIHTHVFAQQFPVLDENRRVSRFLFEARERGVVFDLGHGAASFWFRNAVPALRGGFPPDSISTDMHMGNINGPVFSMLATMSKFLSMGMPLEEVIRRSTVIPARIVNRPELGTLTPGVEADVAVFKLQEGRFAYPDCGRARLVGNRALECLLTIRGGEIVHNPAGLGLPEWEQAPAAYWEIPALQK